MSPRESSDGMTEAARSGCGPNDMDRITSGEVPVEDVAEAVVKLAANGKWYLAGS
jgi:hypothetical protein